MFAPQEIQFLWNRQESLLARIVQDVSSNPQSNLKVYQSFDAPRSIKKQKLATGNVTIVASAIVRSTIRPIDRPIFFFSNPHRIAWV